MSSSDQGDDDFGSPPAEPMEATEVAFEMFQVQPEDAFEQFLEKPEDASSSSPSSSESNAIGFDDFLNTMDLPPELKTLEEVTPRSPEMREEVKNIHKMVAEMYVGDADLERIQQEREILNAPPQPTGVSLLGCPFVLKLYLAASSDRISMLNWSRNGRQLVVNYEALQEHLTAGSRIFRCRSVKQFTGKLKTEGFARIHKEEVYAPVPAIVTLKPMLLYYQQPEFVRGDLDRLHKLMEESLLLEKYYPEGAQYGKESEEDEDVDKVEEHLEFSVPLYQPSKSHLERMQQRGDKCCSTISSRSPIQEARCRFRTLLNHLATTKVLQASAHLNRSTSTKKGRPWDFPTFTSSSIKFVRPHDSVITLDAHKPPPEYAGYYGQVSPTKVNNFFAEYLPRYGNKTTGYKDIVLETTHKPSNFQQNLPIGLASSDSEDNDPDDVQPPVSPAGQDSDMDCMPSTSAAAAIRSKRSSDSVDDQDLEEAMQELCGGSTALKENASSGSRGRPKIPKATSRKRRAKSFESSSSDNEAEFSLKAKRRKKDTAKDNDEQEVLPKKRGPKPKAKNLKTTSRKRYASPSKDEESPPRKRAKKGVQDSRMAKNKQLGEDEFLVKKKSGQKKNQLPETDEENEFEEEENEEASQDEAEYAEEDEYLEEEIAQEDEHLGEDEQPEDDDQPEEDQTAEEDDHPQEALREEEYYTEEYPEDEQPEEEQPVEEHSEGEHPEEDNPEEDEQSEEDMNADENQEAAVDEDIEEDLDTEEDEDVEEDKEAKDEDADEDENAKEDEEAEEDEDDEEDAEDNEEDDDDDDYSVQYRAAPQEPEKPRRYHLRNSMRKSN